MKRKGLLGFIYIAFGIILYFFLEQKKVHLNAFIVEHGLIINVSIFMFLILSFTIFYQRRVSKKNLLINLFNRDELTGLLSKTKFELDAQEIIVNANESYSLISIDINNFKYINEVYGYKIGSDVLRLVAKHLQARISEGSLVARLHSDNFIVLVKTSYLSEHRDLMDEDRMLAHLVAEILGENYNFSVSMGIYTVDDSSLDVHYMIDCANYARSYSKNFGLERYCMYTNTMDEKRANDNVVVSQMERALKNREYVIYFQPKIELSTGTICGLEALVRWKKDGKLVPPNSFIPVFEKNGFIEKIDYYVVDEVCQFINRHQNIKLPKVSINLSSITMVKEDLVENLANIVASYGIDPQMIEFEITESAFVESFDVAIDTVDALRNLKFSISIDDFGKGISTLHRLKDISVDILKIDQAFLFGILGNDKGAIIIKNIVQMAKELKITTVIEGVETLEEKELVKELHCDIAQGFYFYRPMPEESLIELFRK